MNTDGKSTDESGRGRRPNRYGSPPEDGQHALAHARADVLEGEIRQIIEAEDQDGYVIASWLREVLEDRSVAVLWPREVSDLKRRVADTPVLGGVIPLGIDAETLAIGDDVDLEVGDRVTLEVREAFVEETIVRGEMSEREVKLYDVVDTLEVRPCSA